MAGMFHLPTFTIQNQPNVKTVDGRCSWEPIKCRDMSLRGLLLNSSLFIKVWQAGSYWSPQKNLAL